VDIEIELLDQPIGEGRSTQSRETHRQIGSLHLHARD